VVLVYPVVAAHRALVVHPVQLVHRAALVFRELVVHRAQQDRQDWWDNLGVLVY
jgi:hypothetical protein